MSDEPAPHRGRKTALRAALATVSTLLALALAEIVFRMAGLAPPMQAIRIDDEKSPYVRSQSPILRYELKAGFRGDYPEGAASVNSLGFRGVERTVEKPADVRRVILLGDSVTEGISYHDDDDTLDRRLQALYPGSNVEILNLGVSGYCTLAEIESLRLRGLRFNPDVVVVIFTVNDYQNFNPEHSLPGGGGNRPKFINRLFENSHLFRRTSLQLNLFRFRDELDPSAWNHEAIGENNVVQGLDLLVQLAEESRFKPLIAIWPLFVDDAIRDEHFMSDARGDLVIERLAWARGIPTRRLSKDFVAHWQSHDQDGSPRKIYSVRGDEMHPNALAASIASKALRDLIENPPPVARKAPPEHDVAAVDAARLIGRTGFAETRPMEERVYRTLLNQSRAADAYAHLESILREEPDNYFALMELGVSDLQNGNRTELALSRFERAIGQKPGELLPNYYLGVTLYRLEQFERALPFLRRAYQLEPTDQDVAQRIALIEKSLLKDPAKQP